MFLHQWKTRGKQQILRLEKSHVKFHFFLSIFWLSFFFASFLNIPTLNGPHYLSTRCVQIGRSELDGNGFVLKLWVSQLRLHSKTRNHGCLDWHGGVHGYAAMSIEASSGAGVWNWGPSASLGRRDIGFDMDFWPWEFQWVVGLAWDFWICFESCERISHGSFESFLSFFKALKAAMMFFSNLLFLNFFLFIYPVNWLFSSHSIHNLIKPKSKPQFIFLFSNKSCSIKLWSSWKSSWAS